MGTTQEKLEYTKTQIDNIKTSLDNKNIYKENNSLEEYANGLNGLVIIPNEANKADFGKNNILFGNLINHLPCIDFGDNTKAPYFFNGLNALTQVDKIIMGNITDVKYLFSGYSAPNIPLLETSNISNMSYMFSNLAGVISFSGLDTSNAINMSSMFYGCNRRTIYNEDGSISYQGFTLPEMDTSNVTDMSYMFYACLAISSYPTFDVSNVTNSKCMFYQSNLTTTEPITINFPVTTNVTQMFSNSKIIEVGNVNFPLAENAVSLFQYCSNLTSVGNIDLHSANIITSLFQGCSNLTTIGTMNISNAQIAAGLFQGCKKLTAIPDLDTSNITNLYRYCYQCELLEYVLRQDWSNVENASEAFRGCTNLTVIGMDQGGIPVSTNATKVTNLQNIFANCPNLTSMFFNKLPSWLATLTAYNTQGTNQTLKWLGLTQEQAEDVSGWGSWSQATALGWTTGY